VADDMVAITQSELDIKLITEEVYNDQSGAVSVFVGNVRNATNGRNVLRLEFETYEKMALLEMRKIVDKAKEKWPITAASIVHRIGNLAIGDTAVIIAVATPHRADSFAACQYMIDTLKQTVPIWKKEIFEDGEIWVSAHP
jgi:molybdopterin synthase catalytic subunit